MWTAFFVWLTGRVNTFIAVQVGVVAGLLTPAIITLATIYVMLWGWLHLTGKIEEPLLEGAKRIFTIAGILFFSLALAGNVAPILDTFVNSPQNLAAGILGGTPMGAVDAIWRDGSTVADNLLSAGSILSASGLGYILCGVLCYLLIGLVTLYVAFLMTLALVALAVLLALGPLFIAMLFFDATKRFFEAWIAQLANYALVIILVATVANLLLRAILVPVATALGAGSGVTVAEGFRMCVFAGFVLLIMRQVLPMAAGLASGIALASGNIISRAVTSGLRGGRSTARGMYDAMTGGGTTRYDPMSRKGGYYTALGAGKLAQATWRAGTAPFRRGNTVSPSGGGGAPRTGAASRGAPRLPPKK